MDFQLIQILQLLLAALLGFAIGIERSIARKEAGIRTYSLVALGACIFTLVSFNSFGEWSNLPYISFDPGRIAAQIVSGVGFLGAGVIIFSHQKLSGLTSAAALWASAAVGMAVGVQMYAVAVTSTFIVLTILYFVRVVNIEVRLHTLSPKYGKLLPRVEDKHQEYEEE